MYWVRTGNPLDILAWLLLSAAWWVGGWLLVTHVFRLPARERLLSGLATGLVLFIVLSNLFSRLFGAWLPLPVSFWSASMIILAAGLVASWRASLPARFNWSNLRYWPHLVVLLALTLFFTLIGRGLSLFDDYLHIPLVSVMAAGDIPPRFYLDPNVSLAYHYGLQVFTASLIRVGGFFPWSAWDLSKALAIALTLALGWLWIRRITRSSLAAYLGSVLVVFGGGARWLLLLLPPSVLLWISNSVQLINTGADSGENLFLALAGPWKINGAGPFPFPFSFHNGIFVPVMFALGASGALPYLTVILLLILIPKQQFSILASLVISLLFASLALSAEHLFVFLWGGVALAGFVTILWSRFHRYKLPKNLMVGWAAILVLSGILSVVQGAFLTEAVRNILLGWQGLSATQGAYNYFEFSPRWPPALNSAHLAELSLFNLPQLLVLLAELGPASFLAPLATIYALRQLRRRDWLAAGLGIAGLVSILLPLFFRYGVERSSTRLPATALWVWVLLGFPILWFVFQKAKQLPRFLIVSGYGIAIFSGFVILAIQIISIPYPQFAYFINASDARISRAYWDQLPEAAQVFDATQERAVALFGRPAYAYQDFYHPWPEWEVLVSNPDPSAIARAGYSFVYLDKAWWDRLNADQKQAFEGPCVRRLAEQKFDSDFRWLLDVQNCR